jgi:hypothetical protein
MLDFTTGRTRVTSAAILRFAVTAFHFLLDKLFEDRLDGFIEPFLLNARMGQAQRRLMDQKSEHQSANHNYVNDGVRLLELAKTPWGWNFSRLLTLAVVNP